MVVVKIDHDCLNDQCVFVLVDILINFVVKYNLKNSRLQNMMNM